MSGTSNVRLARRWRVALVPAGLIATVLVTPVAARAASVPREPPQGLAAAAGELVNQTTGRELWGREQNVVRPIASITKVMTALVVIKAGHLDRRITITQAEYNYVLQHGASGAGLIPGDVLTARQLLYAMLLPSGADAAMALAISYGPGVAMFVRKMNALARALHMARTHFTNFDGLQPTDKSTPGNLMLLGEAAMRHAAFRAVVARKSYVLRAGDGHHYYHWWNRNKLLWDYRGATGIKTGWIPASGECLLFEAVRGTRVLIGVVLDSAPTDTSNQTFIDATRLLDWGFEPRI